jgi:hypothetical protein
MLPLHHVPRGKERTPCRRMYYLTGSTSTCQASSQDDPFQILLAEGVQIVPL